MNAARAGLLYGTLAFATGAALGPLREIVLAPRLGGMVAAVVEAAAMAALLWCIARLALAQLPAGSGRRNRATVASVALLVVVALDAALGLAFAVTGLADARTPRTFAEQAVVVPLLAWLVVLPFLVRRDAVALS